MRAEFLHDKKEIEAILRQDVSLHLYEIGDLDDFFWPYTSWYTLKQEPSKPIILLYTGQPLPTLLALTNESDSAMQRLIQSIMHLLPAKIYAHLSENLAAAFDDRYHIESHGVHCKMILTNHSKLNSVNTSDVVPLTEADLSALKDLYQISYPDNWFDPYMLKTGFYFGIHRNSDLVSVAGVHVYSWHYGVAALGNITTHPHFRGQGLAQRACAKLCQSLIQTANHIGLNVKADNTTAIRCYENLGFNRVSFYQECLLELKKVNTAE
jgi:predicted GNAT family acetyltransferase